MTIDNLKPHINVDEALARLLDDKAMFLEILGLMLEEFSSAQLEWSEKIRNRLVREVSAKAHYFKGIAWNLSATRYSELTVEIEQASKAEDWATVEASFEQLKLENEMIVNIHRQIPN